LNDLAGSYKFELLSRPKTVARLISVLAFQKASLATLQLLQTCYLRAWVHISINPAKRFVDGLRKEDCGGD
jgi:hypothetical protein